MKNSNEMNEIALKRKMQKQMTVINDGSEGVVYKYNDQAVKIFTAKFIDGNKLNKIKELNKMNLENFVLPQELVLNGMANPIGYTMDYVDAQTDVRQVVRSNKISLHQKIAFLKQTEELMKNAHEQGIVLGDVNLFNFLIDENDTVKAIDTDNYQVGEYLNDIEPDLFFPLYRENISKNITTNTDKYSFLLHILKDLLLTTNDEDIKMINNIQFVKELIDKIEMPNELKDFVDNQIFTKEEKKYPCEYLEEYINYDEPFLKIKH